MSDDEKDYRDEVGDYVRAEDDWVKDRSSENSARLDSIEESLGGDPRDTPEGKEEYGRAFDDILNEDDD
jgi:hypothetical protein